MEDIFKLKGKLLDTKQNKLANYFVAIADDDWLDGDDLIGLGATDENGEFKVSFLGSEFRQDMFEDEAFPDVVIVVSAMFGKERKAIFTKTFADLKWEGKTAGLGDIILEGVDLENPKALDGVEAIPGGNKRGERLDIDDDMVRNCLVEVAPIVEHLTGWKGLLDDLKVEVADSLAPYMLRESLIADGIDPNSATAKFSAFFADFAQGPGAGCGLYDPHIHTLVINRKIMSQVGIEGLKIICGHELVHVGQYKYTPGLKAYNLNHLRSMSVNPESFDPEEAQAKAAYMIELEGYAKYIEEDFLHQKYYKLALLNYHASITEKIIQALVSMAMGSAKTEASKKAKANQYTEGLERYRKRQVGDRPAAFELDVASLPGGEAFV
ncbi:MAG: hypothetical protein GY810_28850 [Aureispira sp.]|nr:hypothetical protein [Aureispira sp.]